MLDSFYQLNFRRKKNEKIKTVEAQICYDTERRKEKIHHEGAREEGKFSVSMSSAVKPGKVVSTVDGTHVDDIIFLLLGNVIKLKVACNANIVTTRHPVLTPAK